MEMNVICLWYDGTAEDEKNLGRIETRRGAVASG